MNRNSTTIVLAQMTTRITLRNGVEPVTQSIVRSTTASVIYRVLRIV